jgi:signal-transduction protein with cAMP-binding, CBS, and nucleotidyltransferase domain
MYVAQLCSRTVVTIHPNDEVVRAAQLMREHHVGYLVVVAAEQPGVVAEPVGVLTDRDIVVGVVARGVDVGTLTVRDVMTAKPVVVAELDSVETAVSEMRRIGVRRMRVVGRLGEIKGVLSLDDVLEAVSGELRDLSIAIRKEQGIESASRA